MEKQSIRQGPKARPIPAWGAAPGKVAKLIQGLKEGAEKVSAVAFGDERGASAPRKSLQIRGALAPGPFRKP